MFSFLHDFNTKNELFHVLAKVTGTEMILCRSHQFASCFSRGSLFLLVCVGVVSVVVAVVCVCVCVCFLIF